MNFQTKYHLNVRNLSALLLLFFKCQATSKLFQNCFKIVYCTCFQVPKRTYFTISSHTWAYLLLMSMDSLTDACYQKFSFSRKFTVVVTLDISILYFFLPFNWYFIAVCQILKNTGWDKPMDICFVNIGYTLISFPLCINIIFWVWIKTKN